MCQSVLDSLSLSGPCRVIASHYQPIRRFAGPGGVLKSKKGGRGMAIALLLPLRNRVHHQTGGYVQLYTYSYLFVVAIRRRVGLKVNYRLFTN